MKKTITVLTLLLSGCAQTSPQLIAQLLEDIQVQKNQNQALVQQANQAIAQCNQEKEALKKKPVDKKTSEAPKK